MRILGIETSCDETAAAVVEDGNRLLSNVVLSSMDLHKFYGGVVPEIAARSHIEAIMPVVEEALASAFPEYDPRNRWREIDGIAVTYGAGLGGSLLVGVMTARTLAIIMKKPLYAINHVEAHIYANFLTVDATRLTANKQPYKSSTRKTRDVSSQTAYRLPSTAPKFPMLGLIVSGGHSQLVLWRDHFDYTLLGQTQDDAIGEAFDKVAKILGLPYPGGPSIGKKALEGDAFKYNLPKSKIATINPALAELRNQNLTTPSSQFPTPKSSYDYSFSGLKTAVLRLAQAEIGEDYTFPSTKLADRLSEAQKADIAASFQRVAIETVVDKTATAYEEFQPKSVVIGGGVAASPELRHQLSERLPIKINYTDPRLMTDNGAMIATLGCFKHSLKQPAANPYSLEVQPNLSM